MPDLLSHPASQLRDLARTTAVAVPAGHVIDATSVAGSGHHLDLVHPGDGAVTGAVAVGTAEEVDAAVRSAHDAFSRGEWARLSPRERGGILSRFADLIDEHRDQLALLETLDMGKPIRDAYTADVPKSANMTRWYATGIDKQYDQLAPTGHSTVAMIRRVPVGVVGCITPWNFPLYQAAYKLGPVLATGNSLVIKPSELAPRSTVLVAHLAARAGLPPGVLNVVTGDGSTGAALAAHPLLAALAFTGSPRTAAAVSAAAAPHLTRVSIESGGKSAHVVLPDPGDLETIARAVADGFCYNQGQVCSAGTRLIVPDAIADDLLDRVVDHVQAYQPGDPFDPATRLGPVVSARHLRGIDIAVVAAQASGAKTRFQQQPTGLPPGGSWYAPVILDHVDPQAPIAQHEVFGPVLSVLRYDGDPSHAVDLANATGYGLGAALWTRDVDAALGLSQHLRAGQVWVNNYDGADYTVPWGGFGLSGLGRDKSLEALHEYTASSTTWIEVADTYRSTESRSRHGER